MQKILEKNKIINVTWAYLSLVLETHILACPLN